MEVDVKRHFVFLCGAITTITLLVSAQAEEIKSRKAEVVDEREVLYNTKKE